MEEDVHRGLNTGAAALLRFLPRCLGAWEREEGGYLDHLADMVLD